MSAIVTLLAAVASITSYDCVLEPPQSLIRDADKVLLRTINFPQLNTADWHFKVRISRGGDNETADVDWPKDPIQIAGMHPVFQTSEGSLAFVAVGGGGCMFTEQACLTDVHIVDAPLGAKVVIMPTALASDLEQHTREPMIVIIEGHCKRGGDSQ